MQISNQPRRISVTWAAQAGAGFIRNVPDSGTSGGAASYSTGFPPATFQPIASGGSFPSGQDMNGVLADLSAWARWSAAGGAATFDAAFAGAVGGYPFSALLASTTPGTLWQSTVDGNTSNPDASGANGWIAVTIAPGDMSQNVIRHRNSFVEQWGTVNASSYGEPVVGVSLVVPFYDGSYNIAITPAINGPSGTSDTWVQIIQNSKSTTSFSVQYQRPGGSVQPYLDGFDWRCIGRSA